MGKIKQPFRPIKLSNVDLLKIAYNAGRTSNKNNVRLHENPYPNLTDKSKEWENGWLDQNINK